MSKADNDLLAPHPLANVGLRLIGAAVAALDELYQGTVGRTTSLADWTADLVGLAAAAMLGILNAVFRPIALIITLPINILSFGLFTFIINAAMLKMASALIPGFDVTGFWTAVFGSLFISIISFLINSFISDRGSVEYIELRHKGGNRWEA